MVQSQTGCKRVLNKEKHSLETATRCTSTLLEQQQDGRNPVAQPCARPLPVGFTWASASSSVYVHGRRRSVPYALWWRRRGPSCPGSGGGVARLVSACEGSLGRASSQVLAQAASGGVGVGTRTTLPSRTGPSYSVCRHGTAAPSVWRLAAMQAPPPGYSARCEFCPRAASAHVPNEQLRPPRLSPQPSPWWVPKDQCPRSHLLNVGMRTSARGSTWFANTRLLGYYMSGRGEVGKRMLGIVWEAGVFGPVRPLPLHVCALIQGWKELEGSVGARPVQATQVPITPVRSKEANCGMEDKRGMEVK